MKKFIIIVVIIIVIVASIDPCVTYYIDKGFEEKNPDKCLSGVLMQQKIWRHKAAISNYKKILRDYPNFAKEAEVRYNLAYCYEQAETPKLAIEEYNTFLAKFPNHEKVKIAEKRLSTLKANSTSE